MHYTSYTLTILQQANVFSFLKMGALLLAGFYLARLSSNAFYKIISRYVASSQAILLRKLIYFTVFILFVIAALQELGFKLSVLLGSAGIVTAAIAIASQTSISNIISGLFLIMERSFKIGDKIKIGTTTGVITSIDLLSVKILTSTNTLIRIPNEFLIKSEITNVTRFDSRRLDLEIKVAAEQDLDKVKNILLAIAKHNAISLSTPLPSVSIKAIDGGDVTLQFSIWANQKNYDDLSNSLYHSILMAFKENNISLSQK
jgi:small-conductance mechanosensitive channel